MISRYVILFLSAWCLLGTPLNAQQNTLGSWNILNVRYNVSKRWALFGEGQVRSLGFYNNFHYHEYKLGATYELLPNFRVSLAAGDYDTYREGGDFSKPKTNDEFRLWPQFSLNQSLKRVTIEQRYRVEFRFTNNGYRQRFRYRLGLSYPLGKATQGSRPFQLAIGNELFFGVKEPYFERNRLNGSISWKFAPNASVLMGYMYQFDYKINDETGRDFLQIGLYLEPQRKQKKTGDTFREDG